MRWLVAALAVVLSACSATPAAEIPLRSGPTPITTVSETLTDDEFIRTLFKNFVERVNSGDGKAAMAACTPASFTFAEQLQQHALRSTESRLAQLPTLQHLLVYALRHAQPPTLFAEGEAGALEAVLTVFTDFVAPVDLTGLKVIGDGATATAAQPGTDSIVVTFAHNTAGSWALDYPALVEALSDALDQLAASKSLSSAQMVDQVLATRFGAARAAELRTPLK
ncbi:hypothetical protein [Lentzea guizhouensis]|nr:hypothetical protein [Lentzea guizhouensis]